MKWLAQIQLITILRVLATTSALESSSRVSAAEKHGTQTAYTEGSDEVGAISHLTSRTRQQDAIFSEAVQLLDSLKTSPSCNRIAANKLVASCQDLGGNGNPGSNAYEILDRTRSVYAARLAICELDGAGASVPSPCLPVTATPPATKTRFGFATRSKAPDNGSDIVSYELLEQCLRALESRPQWWTSYSNSRQNAVTICQAARMEIEQEELLNLHRSILKGSIQLDEGLQAAIRNAAMEAKQHQAFVQAIQELQKGLLRDIEKTQSVFQKAVGRLLHEVEAGIGTVVAAVNAASNHLRTEAAVVQQGIRNASNEANALQVFLQAAHREAKSRDLQTLRAQEEHNKNYMKLTSDLHLSLESLTETDMARLSEGVARFDTLLEWLTGRLVLILEQENNMSERLQYIETALQTSQTKANELQDAQHMQAQALAAQTQTQHTLQSSALVSQALLDQATTSAANLHALIDEAATKYKHNPGLHFTGTTIWTMFLAFLIAMGSQSPKFAVSIFFLIFGHLIATWFLRFF